MSLSDTCFLVPGISRGECASWVQAWGSIVAIIAAAGIVFVQHVLDRRREAFKQHETDRRLLTIALSVATDAQDLVNRIGSFRSNESHTEMGQHRQGFYDETEFALQAVRAIFLMQLPTSNCQCCEGGRSNSR